MYYLLNYIFICFLTIAIALVYTKGTSIGRMSTDFRAGKTVQNF